MRGTPNGVNGSDVFLSLLVSLIMPLLRGAKPCEQALFWGLAYERRSRERIGVIFRREIYSDYILHYNHRARGVHRICWRDY